MVVTRPKKSTSTPAMRLPSGFRRTHIPAVKKEKIKLELFEQ